MSISIVSMSIWIQKPTEVVGPVRWLATKVFPIVDLCPRGAMALACETISETE